MERRVALPALAFAAWSMIGAALIIGFVTRIAALSWYISFEPDQVNDAYAYARMWNGAWPVFGPHTTVGFMMPPSYYYLVFPFTLFGHDPWLQALPNALFSFLSIPLLIYTLYVFLGDLPPTFRLFWAGIGGLWWSFLYADIVIGTMEWIPSSVPFFVLLFALLAAAQIRRAVCDRAAVIAWSILGVLLALMVSLAGSALYVMPVVFVILGCAFIIRASSHMKAAAIFGTASAVALCCLAPYWVGQMQTHWQNTQQVIALLHDSATTAPPQEKFENAWRGYKWLSGQVYFVGSNAIAREGGVVFLIIIAVLGILKFRGDSALFAVLACLWIVTLYASANHAPWFMHYRLLITAAPIFLTVSALAFLDYDLFVNRAFACFLLSGVIASMIANAPLDIKREAETFGPYRILSVSAIEDAFSSIPYGARVCTVREGDPFVDEYVTRRNLQFSATCIPGSYEIVPTYLGEYYFIYDFVNYNDVYIRSFDVVPGPKVPAQARVIKQTKAFTLILIEKEFAPLIRDHLSSRPVNHALELVIHPQSSCLARFSRSCSE
jgi:hypothetical protein